MILHVDMDAFYASVEERDNPALAGKPVIVGGSAAGRGVVSAANYKAREFGVHSAMPALTAKRLCPHGVFLPVRMSHYAAIARQIREIFHRYTPLVEPLSLDEAFLDVTGSEKLFGTSEQIGRQLKADIRREVQLVASVGVAANKFIAKIASDLDKPDGFVVVDPGREQEFLDPLPISRIWGVGKVSEQAFHRQGIRTIGQLRQVPQEAVAQRLGKAGDHIWRLAHGLDDRNVVPDRVAKSISHETTFAVDIDDPEALRGWALELTEQVARRLRRVELRGRTVQLKVRFSDFKTVTRSLTVSAPTNTTQDIWNAVAELLGRLPPGHLPVRLIGVGVSDFEAGGHQQQLAFDAQESTRQHQLDNVLDQIKDRFGSSAVSRGGRRPKQP